MRMKVAGMLGVILHAVVFFVAASTKALSEPLLSMTMMMRDEAVNINANLPLWIGIVDYFVFLIDRRTTDSSKQDIIRILDHPSVKGYEIIDYDFLALNSHKNLSGFGGARTLSLEKAYEHFPQATHVWIADPDWRAEVSTINKQDLDLSADAFRFVIYDRNGMTTRRCDWLLKNRKGLAMRYHLHEVLDIGDRYDWKVLSWEVREIEKPGSWHTTVGHGHSMSAQRYLFDLELLEKDVPRYGHDPHTHYYLGVTHEAYADKLFEKSPVLTDEVIYHINASIHYLSLRALSTYRDEFLEERWAVMMMMGSMYARFLQDFTKGQYWLSMCRDFNPHQIECGMALVSLYYNHGSLKDALKETEKLFRTKYENRAMLNHYKSWDCEMPRLGVRVLGYKHHYIKDTPLTLIESKYATLLYTMVNSDLCRSYQVFMEADNEALFQKMALDFKLDVSSISQETLCNDVKLQHYMIANEIKLHGCKSLKERVEVDNYCSPFFLDYSSSFQEYFGAWNLFDVVHSVYGGDINEMMTTYSSSSGKKRVYRALFPEYFHYRGLYRLMGQLLRLQHEDPKFNFEVVVVTNSDIFITNIKKTINFCGGSHSSVRFVEDTLDNFLLMVDKNSNKFDYIEFNGGLNLRSAYRSILSSLGNMLSPSGVIGLTAYMSNRMVDEIRTLLSERNTLAHLPFSADTRAFVKAHLERGGYILASKDEALLDFLANTESAEVFSPDELIQDIVDRDLQIIANHSAFQQTPYSVLDDYTVLSYRSFGIGEEQFIWGVLQPFRYTLYVGNKSRKRSAIRTNQIKREDFEDNDIVIIDATGGYLPSVFKDGVRLGHERQSIKYTAVHPLLSPKDTRLNSIDLSFVCLPEVLPALSIIGKRPSLKQLIEMNQKTFEGDNYVIELNKARLMGLVSFLIKTDQVKIIRNVPSKVFRRTQSTLTEELETNMNGDVISSPSSSSIGSIADTERKIPPSSSTQRTETNVANAKKVGGLTVIKPSKPTPPPPSPPQPTSPSQPTPPPPSPPQPTSPSQPTPPPPSPPQPTSSGALEKFEKLATALKEKSASLKEANTRLTKLGFSDDIVEQYTGYRNRDESDTKRGDVMGKILELQKKLEEKLDTIKSADSEANLKEISSGSKSIGGLKVKKAASELHDQKTASMSAPKRVERQSTSLNGKTQDNNVVHTIPSKKVDGLSPSSRGAHNSGATRKDVKVDQQILDRDMFLDSSRGPDCNLRGKKKCDDTIGMKRRATTSSIYLTSPTKLKFDIEQLKHIAFERLDLTDTIIGKLLPSLQSIYKKITHLSDTDGHDKTHFVDLRNHMPVLKEANALVNKALFVAPEPKIGGICHQQALDNMELAALELQRNDFAVVDVVLESKAVLEMSNALLTSTIWYDMTKGNTFAAHPDDGLVHSVFKECTQEIAMAMSASAGRPFKVDSYYALAVDLSTKGTGPLSMGENGEIVVALWINPSNPPPSDGTTNDGIFVHEQATSGKLKLMGANKHKTVHSSFLSTSDGNLDLSLDVLKNEDTREIIPRSSNRMVLIAPNLPFQVVTPGQYKNKPFSVKTALLLVIVLKK